MSTKKNFLKNASVFGGYSYLSMIFDTILVTVVLSRFIGPGEYGFVGLITIFSGFILLFSNTGLSQAVVRSGYGLTFQKLVFNLSLWIGVALTLGMCLLAYPITLVFDNPKLFMPAIVVSLQFLSNSLVIVPHAILQKKLSFSYMGLIQFLTVVFTISMQIVMAVLGCSFWALIVPLIFRPIFEYILLERHLKFGIHIYGWKYTKLGFKQVRSLLTSISIFNFINYFARNADNFAIGKFYGEVSLGLYGRAYKFLYMARRLINSSLGPVLFPSLVEAKSRGEDIKPHFLDILGVLNFINIFIAIPLILFAKPICLILWGQDWVGVAEYMPYIGAIIPLQTLAIAAMDLYVLENKEKALLYLGIPLSLILVVGIAVGAFFSSLHIVRFYALAFTLVQTPVSLFFGHYRIFKFTAKQILLFWGPKIILTGGIIFSIWFGNEYISAGLLALFMLQIVLQHGRDIIKILKAVKNKLLKR